MSRKIRERQIHRATVILSLSMLYITLVNFLLDKFEEKGCLTTFFEVVSAFSIVGRVGILIFMIVLIEKERKSALRYLEARIKP